MVNAKEFQALKEILQIHLLRNEAILLMTRKTSRVNVKLYGLYDFYVEVFIDRDDDDPLYIKAFQDEKKIDVYLEMITLQHIQHG